jgi:hypothetical protein
MKTIPKFTTVEEEQTFWESHDSTEFLDWEKAKKVKLPNLNKSTKTISLRLLDQSLIKMFLQKELGS